MSGNNRNNNSNNNRNNNNNNSNNRLDVSMIKDYIELQKKKISIEKSELELKKQDIKNQADLARQSLNIQEKLLEKAPTEKRKDRNQILLYSTFFTLIILGFAVFCLTHEFEEFLTYLFGTLSHLAVLALGYYFGTHNKKDKQSDSDIQDAEIIE